MPESTPEFNIGDLELDETDPNFAEYKRILERFSVDDVSVLPLTCHHSGSDKASIQDPVKDEAKGEVIYSDYDNVPDEEDEKDDDEEQQKLSKKARKARDKLSVAELKVRW